MQPKVNKNNTDMYSKKQIKESYNTAQDYAETSNVIGMIWDNCNGRKVTDFIAETIAIVGKREYEKIAQYICEEIISMAVLNFGIDKGNPGIVSTYDKYIQKNYNEINL